MNLYTFFAYDASDSDDVRLQKFAIFLVAGSCTFAGVIWTLMYYAIFGLSLTTALPFSFVVIVGFALVLSHFTKNHYYAIYTQIFCITYITAVIQWSIGSVVDSGLVLIWGLIGPVCALMFLSIRQAFVWFALYLVNLVLSFVIGDTLATGSQPVSVDNQLLFFAMNIGVSSTVIFLFASYYVNEAIKEQNIANKLLKENLQQEIMLRENEKLATLGRLSAGVAHELNNPAAAAQRGAEYIRETIAKLGELTNRNNQVVFNADQVDLVNGEMMKITERAMSPFDLDPLTRSDYEYEIEQWLEEKGIEDAWEIAPLLVSIGYNCDDLAEFANYFSGEHLNTTISVFAYLYRTFSLIEEVRHGAGRISEIVKALKSYSYMDQAPSQAVDVHDGIDNTLIMLASKLKSGVDVRRNYSEKLPKIEAYGSELNQVWTNLIDNAVSAMNGKGEIHIKTYATDTCVVVEICDNGPGIPVEIQQKIFDPFFTTKAPGEGTGLGLNLTHNIIVQKHRGKITVDSKPGATCFTVKLPIDYQNPKLDT